MNKQQTSKNQVDISRPQTQLILENILPSTPHPPNLQPNFNSKDTGSDPIMPAGSIPVPNAEWVPNKR